MNAALRQPTYWHVETAESHDADLRLENLRQMRLLSFARQDFDAANECDARHKAELLKKWERQMG